VRAVQRKLLPLALVVTPNLPEAVVLSGRPAGTLKEIHDAARAIADLGPTYVVIKGGHREGEPIDVVYDGAGFTELTAERIDTANTHGTGCTFAAAIAAYLTHGLAPLDAIAGAKRYLTEALRRSYPVGAGHSPVNHFHNVTVPAVPVTR
jgi:hydroxymethylpyrimidine/phosphomethylpyrimidine kinase